MSKSRFTTSDVVAMVRDIRSTLLGQRVANVYDLSDKSYLLKFAQPGNSAKVNLLLESGIRFHTTKFSRDKNDMPSPFAMKLRKFIRTKRLEDIRQLGTDRVVDFRFGSGDSSTHIIMELYASGNIVLTDPNFEVIALLRSHQFEAEVVTQVGHIYPIAFTTNIDSNQANSTTTPNSFGLLTVDPFISWIRNKENDIASLNTAINDVVPTKNEKKGKAKKITLRQLLLSKDSGVSHYGPEIIDHCMLTCGFKSSSKASELYESEITTIQQFIDTLNAAKELINILHSPGQPGYIILLDEKKTSSPQEGPTTITPRDYAEFTPYLFQQYKETDYVEFLSFNDAVDEYFCKIEEQRLQRQANAAEEAARKKVAKVRDELSGQLRGLESKQEELDLAASLVETFADDVDKVALVVNSALANGMAWDDLQSMIETEQANGNPIANLISQLKLEKNAIILKLPNLFRDHEESDSDSDNDNDDEDEYDNSRGDEEADQSVNRKGRKKDAKNKKNKKKDNMFVYAEIDLSLSAHANAGKMHGDRKQFASKHFKTEHASVKAIEAVEKQTFKQLESQKIKRNLQAVRKIFWFEKFNWFISSEGYLVLSGRDAQQNEMLVKRYLRPKDAYVHADIGGAASCVVRHKTEGGKPLPLSPIALQEAGTMTVCRSGAWAAKVVTSAWWVWGTQVTKTAPSGEYLSTGSFMIYGRKNYLAPTALEMGFGILFRLDDASVARHLGERSDKIKYSDEILDDGEDVRDRGTSDTTLKTAAKRYGTDFSALRDEIEMEVLEGEILNQEVEGSENAEVNDLQDNLSRVLSVDDNRINSLKVEIGESIDYESRRNISIRGLDSEGGSAAREGDNSNSESEASEEEEVEGDSQHDDEAVNEIEEVHEGGEKPEYEQNGSMFNGNIDSDNIRMETLNEEGEEVNEESLPMDGDTSTKKGGRLTAKKRKLLKKLKTQGVESTQKPIDLVRAMSSSSANGSDSKEDHRGRLETSGSEKTQQRDQKTRVTTTKGLSSAQVQTDSKASTESAPKTTTKKKFVNKKKARRYANQDEEDIALALQALGHVRPGEKTLTEKQKASEKEQKTNDIKKRQEKVGVSLLNTLDDWNSAVLSLQDEPRLALQSLIETGQIAAGEIDMFELKSLGNFSAQEAVKILQLFSEGGKLKKVGNKSGFLAGIMRRFTIEHQKKTQGKASTTALSTADSQGEIEVETTAVKAEELEAEAMSRRYRKKQEAAEIQAILEEEGVVDEEDGKQADELEKLTGVPVPDDTILFAVPVCGPYVSMQSYKYKVKLTPGTTKKGKAAKQAIELFTRAKDCGPKEKALLKGLSDPEMVAIFIGEVKVSTAGINAVKKQIKNSKASKQKERSVDD